MAIDFFGEDYLRHETRLAYIKEGLLIFQDKFIDLKGEQIVLKDDAAELITLFYFELLQNDVKPFVPKKINKYKITSITELAIIKVQPFITTNKSLERETNAKFAFFTTVSMILDISVNLDNFNKPSGHIKIEELFNNVKTQKLTWLESKKPNDFPIFINALKLYLFFELYHLRFQALAS